MATSDLAPQAREQVIRGRLKLLSTPTSAPAELWAVVAELVKRLPADLDFLTRENAKLRERVEQLEAELELTKFAALPPAKVPPRLPPPLIIEEVSVVEDIEDRWAEISHLIGQAIGELKEKEKK